MQFDTHDQDLLKHTWAEDAWGCYRYERREKIYAHRQVAARLLSPKPLTSRHRIQFINGDKCDCRRDNLLVYAPHQLMPRRKVGKTSRYRGLTWNTQRECWDVKLYRRVGGKPRTERVGEFPVEKEIEAARAYDARARKVFKHPILNFPDEKAVAY